MDAQKFLKQLRGGVYIFSIVLAILTIWRPISLGIYFVYFLIIVVLLVSLAANIYIMIRNPKSSIKTLAGIGFMVLIFLIGWGISPGSDLMGVKDGVEQVVASGNSVKFAGAGIYAALIVIVLTIGAFLYSEISTIFK